MNQNKKKTFVFTFDKSEDVKEKEIENKILSLWKKMLDHPEVFVRTQGIEDKQIILTVEHSDAIILDFDYDFNGFIKRNKCSFITVNYGGFSVVLNKTVQNTLKDILTKTKELLQK